MHSYNITTISYREFWSSRLWQKRNENPWILEVDLLLCTGGCRDGQTQCLSLQISVPTTQGSQHSVRQTHIQYAVKQGGLHQYSVCSWLCYVLWMRVSERGDKETQRTGLSSCCQTRPGNHSCQDEECPGSASDGNISLVWVQCL